MSAPVVGVVVAAAVACPLHMLWRMRKGARGCCAAADGDRAETSAAALRARQRKLATDIARSSAGEDRPLRHP